MSESKAAKNVLTVSNLQRWPEQTVHPDIYHEWRTTLSHSEMTNPDIERRTSRPGLHSSPGTCRRYWSCSSWSFHSVSPHVCYCPRNTSIHKSPERQLRMQAEAVRRPPSKWTMPTYPMPRYGIFAFGCFTMICNAGAVFNKIGAITFWKHGMFFACYQPNGALSYDGCQSAVIGFTEVIQTYISTDLMGGAISGVLLDLFGPKVTVAFAYFVSTLTFLFWLPNCSGFGLLFSVALQGCILSMFLNSLAFIGNLFPEKSSLIIAIISGCADAAALIFPLMNMIIDYSQIASYTTIVWLLFGQAVFGTLFSLLFLPNVMDPALDHFENDNNVLDTPLITMTVQEDSEFKQAFGLTSERPSLSNCVMNPRYILFVIHWLGLLANMNVFLVACDEIFLFNGDTGAIRHAFSYCLPIAFVFAASYGHLLTTIGVVPGCMVVNIVAAICNTCAMIRIPQFQWITLLTFVSYKGCCFTSLMAYISEEFGFDYFGTLISIASFIGGVISEALGPSLHDLALDIGARNGSVTADWRIVLAMFLVCLGGNVLILGYLRVHKKNTSFNEELLFGE